MNAPVKRDIELAWVTAALVAAATLLLMASAVLYTRYGPALLTRLDVSVGEVLMEEGILLENAGDIEKAEQRYRIALESRFEGPQNRAYTLKRLGKLLWLDGRDEESLPCLQEAARSPDAPISTFETLCEVLHRLGRYSEIPPVAATWLEAAQEQGNNESVAAAYFQLGRAAKATGDETAAVAHFEKAHALVSGGGPASELANIHYRKGDYALALTYLDEYLGGGATGNCADHARSLRKKILKKLANPRVS